MQAYITSLASFLPGPPIENDQIENMLGLVSGKPSVIKRKILKQNGIKTRHYAIDPEGRRLFYNYEMAANAARLALKNSSALENEVEYLACATTLSDVLVPGIASLIHGELKYPNCEVASFHGVCASGMAALKSSMAQVVSGLHKKVVVCASEFASRHFRSSIFESLDEVDERGRLQMDADFLRWMLSDGAGAAVIEDRPNPKGISLKIEWIDQKSHAHQLETCMYAGMKKKPTGELESTWSDNSSYETSVKNGYFTLRQDLNLLSNIVPIGVKHYFELIDAKKIQEFDWFVCHYSSHIFKGEIEKLLDKAGATIPEEKWFTNLYTKGNVGSASIYVMLDELFHSGKLKVGHRILCMVPESGRFITSFMLLTVTDELTENLSQRQFEENKRVLKINSTPEKTNDEDKKKKKEELYRELLNCWVNFEQDLKSVPIVDKIEKEVIRLEDYQLLLLNLRQQVMEGSRWISRAASNISTEYFKLRSMFIGHSADEHRDFHMIEKNYISTGGSRDLIENYPKNIGSEAFNAWMFNEASKPNPFHLLGAMFIIEGLGKNIAGKWAEKIKKTLKLSNEEVSFMTYHSENDEKHMDELDQALEIIPWDEKLIDDIIKTAKVTARLYRLQLEELGNY